MIKPTVGRVVWFHPGLSYATQRNIAFGVTDQPLAATIAHVINDNMVNLSYLDQNGNQYSATSVPFKHDEDSVVYGEFYCEWMPYQKEQAALSQASSSSDATNINTDQSKASSKLTDADIDATIREVHYFTAKDGVIGALTIPDNFGEVQANFPALETITLCVLILKNGYKLLGVNHSSVDPKNHDLEYGKKLAYQDARNKIWELEGYLLKDAQYHSSEPFKPECSPLLDQSVKSCGGCSDSTSNVRDERLNNRETVYMLTSVLATANISNDLRKKAELKLTEFVDKLN